MSLEAMRAVFAIPRKELNGSHRMVLAVLAFHHNRDSGKLCPSQKLIADEAGISRPHLARVTKDLIKLGFLHVDSGVKQGAVNQYRLAVNGGATSMLQGPGDEGCNIHLALPATSILHPVQHPCCTELKRTKNERKIVRVRGAHTDSASPNIVEPIGENPNEMAPGCNMGAAPPNERTNGTRLSDEHFIDELKKNVAYKHLNIDVELGKMDAWLLTPKGRGRKKTRTFVVGWLNRIDAPMEPGKKPERKVVL